MKHALLCSSVAVSLLVATPVRAEDLDAQQVRYGFENNSSPGGYLNCTLVALLSNFPAPEQVYVPLRVDGNPLQNVMFISITTDVADQLYQNGKPSSLHKAPIDQAEFATSDFDSLGRMHTLPDDGGITQSSNDFEVFAPLYLNFLSGRFTVRFRREGTQLVRGYTVNTNPGATMAAGNEFQGCMTRLLPQFMK